MAYRKAKRRAYELFANGLWPPDVADELKINVRTIERWFNQWKSENVATSQTPQSGVNVAVESKQVIDQTPHLSTVKSKTIVEWSNEWGQSAISLSDELLLHHGKIRRRLTQMLAEESKKPDLNPRTLNTLSQAIARHSQIEIAVANLSLFDVNKSFKILEAHGYVVMPPSTDESQEMNNSDTLK